LLVEMSHRGHRGPQSGDEVGVRGVGSWGWEVSHRGHRGPQRGGEVGVRGVGELGVVKRKPPAGGPVLEGRSGAVCWLGWGW
jgi:hypothetical protein